MERIKVVDLPEMTLWYHADKRVVHHQMHRRPPITVLESVLEKGLEVLKERGAQKWLSDDRKGGALPRSHQEWAATNWGPRMAEIGWRYWALLPPQRAIGQLSMQRLQKTYSSLGVTVEVFSDYYEALGWLVKCQE